MRKLTLVILFSAVLAASAALVAQSNRQTPAAHMGGNHNITTPESLKWQPLAGPALMAVVSGDPSKPGPYVIRIKSPDGFRIPPHWHPQDEHITVLSGTFRVGMGEKFDEATLRDLPTGSFAFMPREMRHFATSRGDVIVQVHGMGPFQVIYVNPADDPNRQNTK
jgi:quercetin dioxygenase-like cupin family protein